MKHIQFQQTPESIMDKRPWAVIVSETGDIVHGRPDATHLVGFGPMGGYEVTVVTSKAIDDPALAIGLRPVFQNHAEMFAVDAPVSSAAPYEADTEHIEHLAKREAEMRKVLDA